GLPAPSLTETGALPAGVTFGPGSGIVSGMPAAGAGGTYPITVIAHNGVGADAVQDFTLRVDESPNLTTAASVELTFGSGGSFTIAASGFPPPALKETGMLPSGVTLTDNGNGTATLGCTSAVTAGVYHFTIDAGNGVGSDTTQNVTLTVLPATPT